MAPPAVGTDLTPGSRANPHAQNLDDHLAGTMVLLASGSGASEILVERDKGLRGGQATATYAGMFALLNPAG